MISRQFLRLYILLFTSISLFAGTTGKIRGVVTGEDGQPLPGANVVLGGTNLGAATDDEGRFYVLNIPPGNYQVSISMIGYVTYNFENVTVQTDLTTDLNAQMSVTVLESGEEVTVYSRQRLIQKDATASAAVISSDVIADSPIETFQDIVQTKAGVTVDAEGDLHFRGGRADEIAYLIDGIPNTNPFNSELGVDIGTNSIQELSVVTGAFSAEYGNAMSGIVNIVTKDAGRNYRGSFSIMGGDMITDYDLDVSKLIRDKAQEFEINGSSELEATFSGPIPFLKDLRFFSAYRQQSDQGYLYGIDRYITFNVQKDSSEWKAFAMNPSRTTNFQTKLSYNLTDNIKLQYNLLNEDKYWREYYHTRKYTKAGHYNRYKTASSHFFKLTHQLNFSNFYTLSYSRSNNNYEYYAFSDPYDERYMSVNYYKADDNYEFYNGGTRNQRYDRQVQSDIILGQFTSQIGNSHELKAGFETKLHNIFLHEMVVQVDRRDEPFTDANGNGVYDEGEEFVDYDGNDIWTSAKDDNVSGTKPDIIIPEEGQYNSSYRRKPVEFSAYVQDKIELENVVLNIGLRMDSYKPDGYIANNWDNPDPEDTTPASNKMQVSPRFSIAYPITDRGKLFFSYGHFFQMPPYERLYHNPDFDVLPGVIKSDIGNADLKPQKTVTYEVGFEQEVTDDAAVYAKMFYRDMRNLLGQRIYILPGGSDSYALFINRDWGNVRGVTLSFDQRFTSFVSGAVDYTYQVAVGNESDPTSTRRDFRLDIEPVKKVVPLDWNQAHAFRFVVNLGQPRNWKVSAIGRLESGYPYTPADVNAILRVADENSGTKPTQLNVDMNAYKVIEIGGRSFRVFTKVYNLLDRRNENFVHDSSGRAGYSLGRYGDISTEEWNNRPHWYSKPREINFGISVEF